MRLSDWADCLVFDLKNYGTFSPLTAESDWVRWATQFINNSQLVGKVPNPAQFTDWQEWAERLCGENI